MNGAKGNDRMRAPLFRLTFALLEIVLFAAALAIELSLFTNLSENLGPGGDPPILDEARRALGASLLFMLLSGYVASVVVLDVIFRARLLSLARAIWLVVLFAVHSCIFFFYLRAPSDFTMSMCLTLGGMLCIIGVLALERLIWRGRVYSLLEAER